MILFCDFNPKIIREYKLNSETENIIENSKIYPSGKGLYMSLFAKKLGGDSEVFMLKGGSKGREIALSLSRLGIDVNYTALKDENVEEVIIRGEESVKDYRTQDPRITMEDRNDILNSFEKFDTELSLAGLAMAIDRDYDFITSIKLAISCGVWENFVEKDKIDMSAIKKIMNSVEVEEI